MICKIYFVLYALFTVLVGAFPQIALGQELRWTHYGTRPLGMGNAYVAVADDYNSLFYNPAGLARLKEWDGELINPTFAASTATKDLISTALDMAQNGSSGTDEVLSILEEFTGKPFYGSFSLTPHLILPNFGLGLGVDFELQASVHREISVDFRFGPTVILPISFAFNTLNNKLSLGATVKAVAAGGVDDEFSIDSINSFVKSDSKDSKNSASSNTGANASSNDSSDDALSKYVRGGVGAGADIGLLFTPIETMEPTLGLSITDVGGTTFKEVQVGNDKPFGRPEARLPSVNTGVSVKPYKTSSQYLLFSMDSHAINQPFHYSKKLNFGTEWGYKSLLKIQSGLHQGELTGGLQFDVGLLCIRLATYTEQLGPVAGQDSNLASRRIVAQLKLLI